MALSARACFAGAAAKAPTQRVARRNRRRMWCLGLRLDAHQTVPSYLYLSVETVWSIQGVIGFQCDDGRVFVFTSKKSFLL